MKKIECYHLHTLEQASEVKRLKLEGKLQVPAGCQVCDARVPADVEDAKGQDVSCVGPETPICPDPKVAKIIST